MGRAKAIGILFKARHKNCSVRRKKGTLVKRLVKHLQWSDSLWVREFIGNHWALTKTSYKLQFAQNGKLQTAQRQRRQRRPAQLVTMAKKSGPPILCGRISHRDERERERDVRKPKTENRCAGEWDPGPQQNKNRGWKSESLIEISCRDSRS